METENVVLSLEEIKTNDESMDEELLKMLDLSKKKKPKKDKDKKLKKENIEEQEAVVEDKPTYSYQSLLERVYSNMEPEERKKINLKLTAPTVNRLSSKKTIWSNFKECCFSINREKDHIQQFILCELNTEGSIDGNGFLMLKGIYNQKNIENLLRKYLSLYVQCLLCRGINSTIQRDQATRLNFLVCNDCKSSRTVQNIVSGFHATTRADRKKEI